MVFTDAESILDKDDKGKLWNTGFISYSLLFEIEQETAEERYNERLKQSKPFLEAM